MEKLQASIYRDKVIRARAMTPEQRMEECFVLSGEAMEQSLAGAMWYLKTDDIESGWREVRRRSEILDKLQDQGFYTNHPQPTA